MIGFLLGLTLGGFFGYSIGANKLRKYVAALEAEIVSLGHQLRSKTGHSSDHKI